MIKRFFFVIVFIFFLPTLTFASFAWSGRMESYQQNRLLERSPHPSWQNHPTSNRASKVGMHEDHAQQGCQACQA